MTDLRDVADRNGLTLTYRDPKDGHPRPVPDATLKTILDALGIDPATGEGGLPVPETMAVPDDGRSWLPDSLWDRPGWGIFCQLYELRSGRNWGIGDFADLAALARIAGEAGADFLGINPVHALFTADPHRRSPFSPSNRRFLNPLYIACDRVDGVIEPSEVAELRGADLVDYNRIARAKLGALRAAWDARRPDDPAFQAFVDEGGEALRLHALFEALSHDARADGGTSGWQGWDAALQDPSSDEVARLAERHAEDVRFHSWLQWLADSQLAEAAQAARDAGMRIGLYLDLAVGEVPDGSSTWSGAAAALDGLSVGAPPDVFADEGQYWGLAAPSPARLAETGFAPFRDMIGAQLKHAGALRIDHAMALWQLFLVPSGESPAAGTHLRYPFPDLLRTLARLSHDRRAVVIGEDLGWVPDGFRQAMETANILSYRILYFEREGDAFHAPAHYPRSAMACLSTHDLPVLSAWWTGDDIRLRAEHGLVGHDRTEGELAHRAHERRTLLGAFRAAGVLEAEADAEAPVLPDAVRDAAHRFIARTPCLLAGVRLADLAGPERPTNVPGTVDDYPNWMPRSPTDLDALADTPAFAATARLMREERPRPDPAA